MRIGPRLREARHHRRLTLEQLAEATSLTKGFISQLERDIASASVASLIRICNALGIEVGSLFESARTDLIRRDDAPRINFGGEHLTEYLVTPANSRDVQIIRSIIEPGGGSGEEPYSLDTSSEVVVVEQGTIEVTVDGTIHRLQAGDTLSFSPRFAHRWRNPSASRRCVVLWVLSPAPW
jgi:transcriptional regulator with XRE-family HTH domain